MTRPHTRVCESLLARRATPTPHRRAACSRACACRCGVGPALGAPPSLRADWWGRRLNAAARCCFFICSLPQQIDQTRHIPNSGTLHCLSFSLSFSIPAAARCSSILPVRRGKVPEALGGWGGAEGVEEEEGWRRRSPRCCGAAASSWPSPPPPPRRAPASLPRTKP